MALGFGKVSLQEWNDAKASLSGDKIDPGDYEVSLAEEVRVLPPDEKRKGQGVVLVRFTVTEGNEKFVGKKLVRGFRFHPNPPSDKITQMNDITVAELVRLCDACNVAPEPGPDGAIDVVENVKRLPLVQPKLLVSVSHNEQGYQDVGSFKPIV